MENGSKFDVKECVRMTSIVCSSENQVQALQFLNNDDLRGFTDFVNNEDVEIGAEDKSHWINSPVDDEGSTLLELALKKKKTRFIETLLQAGARPDLVSQVSGLAPAHLCVDLGDLRLLQLILSPEDRDVNIRTASFKGGLSPLHLASEKGNTEIVTRLLEYEETDVDMRDGRGVQTPLLFAIKNKHQKIAVILIENGSNLDIKAGRMTLREHFKEAFPGLNPDTIKVQKTRELHSNIADKIFSLVKETQLNQYDYDFKVRQFKSYLRFVRNLKEENRLDEVFELTCKKGLHEHAELLLLKGANINTKAKSILEGAFYGHYNIFKLFKKHNGNFTVTKDDTKESVLHIVLKMKSKFADKSSYEKCLDELLNPKHTSTYDQMRRIINKTDQLGNTALHYATQKWPQDTVRRLLELGANIGIKNHWREIPVTNIRPDVLESFLSEFCLTGDGDVNHEDFSMTFRYDFLAPDPAALPDKFKDTSVQDFEEGEDLIQCGSDGKNQAGSNIALPETEPLWYMSQSKEHRHLLKHPVITSFLWFKWQKIRKYFNRNLRFTVLFVFLLTWNIFDNLGTLQGDTTSKDVWFICYLILFIILLFFVVKDWFIDCKNYKRDKSIQNTAAIPERTSKVCWNIFTANWIEGIFIAFCLVVLIFREGVLEAVLISLLTMLLIRELMQMAVSLKRYFSSTENWVEISIMVLTTLLLIPGSTETDGSSEVKRHLAAFLIVLAWGELIVLLGQHPKLREYNIYVTMFFKVLKTFLLFLTWYFMFIIAFGLGFYILLHKHKTMTKGDKNGEEDYKFFDKVWLSLVKTATMLAGELEFSDIPIDLDSSLAPIAYIFFLTFVFLIVIVLFNLLNGLAVSDTGIIRDKAEIYSYKSQVETISTLESMLLGDPFDFLSNVPSRLSSLPSCSLLQQFYSNSILRQAFTKLGASEILLFYKFLRTKSVTLSPNKREEECCCLRVDEMGLDIIAAAKNILIQQHKIKMGETISDQEDMKIQYKALQTQVRSLEQKIDILLKKLP